ncbi:MAG: GNAT family N-acetyltransferase [Anaerovoracaceae bacterium]
MNIDTKRLHIRPFTMNDAEDMHALYILPEVMQPLGMAPAHTSMDETKERLNRWIAAEFTMPSPYGNAKMMWNPSEPSDIS